MSIILAILFAVLISGSKVIGGGYSGYIDRRQTQAINGFFLVLVFMSHFNQYVMLEGVLDGAYLTIRTMLGQLIVTTFLFYSGYGVMYSILNKGMEYLTGMPKNRVLKTLVLFDLAILLYVVMNVFFGISMTVSQVILSLIGWSGVGNSTWYIFAILLMYLITYVSFKMTEGFQKNIIGGLLLSTILIAVYILVMRKLKESQYYNTVFCYAMGLWYAYYKPQIEKFLSKKNAWGICTVLMIIFFGLSAWQRDTNLLINQVYYLFFVAAVVLVSMRVRIDSPVLIWCGDNLLGLYILQRLPMIALGRFGWMLNNPYVYFGLCAIITACLAFAYRYLVINRIQGIFTRNLPETEKV